MPELLQHKNPSQRLKSLKLTPIIGEILPIDFHGLRVAVQNISKAFMCAYLPNFYSKKIRHKG